MSPAFLIDTQTEGLEFLCEHEEKSIYRARILIRVLLPPAPKIVGLVSSCRRACIVLGPNRYRLDAI